MIEMDMGEVHLHLETESRLFSPAHPDQGTMAMLAAAAPAAGDKVLDLGCGYGLVGIYAAKVVGAGRWSCATSIRKPWPSPGAMPPRMKSRHSYYYK